jgi:sugar diacid utilization regulator
MSTLPQQLTAKQLYQENTELRVALSSYTQEIDLLKAIIARHNSTMKTSEQQKRDMLRVLSALSQAANSNQSLDALLRSLAALIAQLLEADLCIIMLLDQQRAYLQIRTSSSSLSDQAFNSRDMPVDSALWERLEDLHTHGVYTEISANDREHLDPLAGAPYKTALVVPLIAGSEPIGVLNCYFCGAHRCTFEDQILLSTAANQASLAIKHHYLAELHSRSELIRSFFADLTNETRHADCLDDALHRRADLLGCDLTKPHAVVKIEILHAHKEHPHEGYQDDHLQGERLWHAEDKRWILYQQIAKQTVHRIQEHFPGSLLYEHEGLLTCLICPGEDFNLKLWLRELRNQVLNKHAVQLVIGIGNLCCDLKEYPLRFMEAAEALQMGRRFSREDGITHFNDLGVDRYLYKIAQMDIAGDPYQEQIASIANYDEEKGAELLRTLGTYLERSGNHAQAARVLRIHINTLRQRLERIHAIGGIDVEKQDHLFALQLALKVYRLRVNSHR